MEEKTCSKCKFATRLKSGGYWCRKKYYDIEGLTCFAEKPDQFADIGKKVLPEPSKTMNL